MTFLRYWHIRCRILDHNYGRSYNSGRRVIYPNVARRPTGFFISHQRRLPRVCWLGVLAEVGRSWSAAAPPDVGLRKVEQMFVRHALRTDTRWRTTFTAIKIPTILERTISGLSNLIRQLFQNCEVLDDRT